MTPRAAAQQIIKAVKATMAAEWSELKNEFEPDMQEDVRKTVWIYVASSFLAIKAKEGG